MSAQIKDYRYIYNLQQAYFYIREGLTPIDEGKNLKTNKRFYKFKDSENLQQIFRKWCNKK